MKAEARDRRVRGVRLSVTERGGGEPILLIHGTGGSALGWGRGVERLEPLGRVIAYDRRGCGDSEHAGDASVREHAEDAAVLLELLDASPAVVIGRTTAARSRPISRFDIRGCSGRSSCSSPRC